MSFSVTVKWGKEKFPDIELNTEEPVEVFRAQLYALSGVPSDRQKIMVKGKTIKDTFKGIPVKNGMMIMMMGSADPLFEKPKEKVVFIEDMDQAAQNKVMRIPLGLENLGNTCYMNACVQTLRACPEFVNVLGSLSGDNMIQNSDQEAREVTTSMANVYQLLKTTNDDSVSPFLLWAILRKYYPQFGEMDPNSGAPMQQDANECWTLLMRNFQNKLGAVSRKSQSSGSSAASSSNSSSPPPKQSSYSNFIDQYFSISMESKLKCNESETEPVTSVKESELQLSCFLDKEVKYLMSGIKNKFSGELEKRAETLDRNAVFSKNTEITRLPAYLSVQMVRFFYKEGKGGAAGVNAKILKDVKFPKTLDLLEVCSEQLKEKLASGRDRFEQMDNWKRNETLKNKEKGEKQVPEYSQTFLESCEKFESSPGDNCSGYYELYGVLTHKGRSSSSGHYVSWTRTDPLTDTWHLFDDENVSEVQEPQVLDLSGGGDWHMSYVLLYGPRRIRKDNAEQKFEESGNSSLTTSIVKEGANEKMDE